MFTGSFLLVSRPGIAGLRVLAPDTIAVAYNDEDDGTGQMARVRQEAKLGVYATHLDAPFEAADGTQDDQGFVTDGADSPWHLTSARGQQEGHSPPFSFGFGGEEGDDGMDSLSWERHGTLTSPVVDLTSAETPVYLTFQHSLDPDAWLDVASIHVLSGEQTTLLADTQTTGGLAATDGFEPAQLDLSAFAGQQIQIQFEYQQDLLFGSEGWYIDDVQVRAPSANRAASASVRSAMK